MAAVVACAVAMLAPALARAGNPLAPPTNAQARERLATGNRHFRAHDFKGAIEQYKQGAFIEDAPVFLLNLGQCYRRLGQYEDAIFQYKLFLDRGKPSGELKAKIEGLIAQMHAELNKQAMTQPPIEPGPDLGSDHAAASSPVEAPKDSPPDPRALAATARPRSATPATAPLTPRIVVTAPPPVRWYDDATGWGLTAGGVVAGGIAAYLLADAQSLDDQANMHSQQDERTELHDRASSRRLVGGITAAVGAGLLAAGIIKLMVHPSPNHATATSWMISPTSHGFAIAGRF